MEPNSLINDAEFWLPREFLTDDDFLVEKENKGGESNNCLFPYDRSHGFELDSGVTKSIGDEDILLSRKMFQSTPEDDISGGFCHNHGFPSKAWGATRSTQSIRCGAGIGCGHRHLNCRTRVSSQATACDLCYVAVEELAMMNINGYNNHSGRGLLDLPSKHPLAAAIVPNDGSGYYYSHKSLQYRKLQAIKYQQLKQQQLMTHHRQLLQQSRGLRVHNSNNKIAGPVDLAPSAWSNLAQRRNGSGMRAVFLGDRTGKRGSTGTGVFLPRRENHSSPATAEKPTIATVLVPARVAHVLNLDESVVHQPPVRSSVSLNDVSWKQRSNNGGFSSKMKMEQPVKEPRLPSDWAY